MRSVCKLKKFKTFRPIQYFFIKCAPDKGNISKLKGKSVNQVWLIWVSDYRLEIKSSKSEEKIWNLSQTFSSFHQELL